MVVSPSLLQRSWQKSLPLIGGSFSAPSPSSPVSISRASLSSLFLFKSGFCSRNYPAARQALITFPCPDRNTLKLTFLSRYRRQTLSGLCTITVLSIFRMMNSEGLHGVSSGDGSACGPIHIDVGGSTVEIIGAPGLPEIDVRRAVDSSIFKQWLSNLNSPAGILTSEENGGASCSLKHVIIQCVDMFGCRVGFVKFKAEVIDKATGKKLPGIVFARGGAVGILILLDCDGEKYAILTQQARVPVGRVILELPAGMLDDDAGDFVGTAAREVEEETGIHIRSSDLVDLTSFLDQSTGRKMLPSPGGCDEEITLLLYRGHVKREVLQSLQGQQTGLQDHGEFIKVHVVPYRNLWRLTADCKALAAITLYEMAKEEGILPPPPNAPELSTL